MIAVSSSSLTWQPTRAPWWTLCLLTVLLALALGGPAACVIHCQRHHAGTHQPIARTHAEMLAGDQAQHHGHQAPTAQPANDSGEQHMPRSEEHPSALTIAVVLPLVLLPALRVRRYLPIARSSTPQAHYPMPPRDPPRGALLQPQHVLERSA